MLGLCRERLRRRSAFPRSLLFIWLAFLVRGLFYCVELPLWEGFDEWAHFAALQVVAMDGRLPQRSEIAPDVVRESLVLTPLARSTAIHPQSTTHDRYWLLDARERAGRQARLGQLTASRPGAGSTLPVLRQYESQQPPLYYALMALPFRLSRHVSLPNQVVFLRFLNVLIASSVVGFTWLLTRMVLRTEWAATLAAATVCLLPGLFLTVCRVANDALALSLMAGTLVMMLGHVNRPMTLARWMILGLLLAGSVLSKAYALALVPLLPLLLLFQWLRVPTEKTRIWRGTLCAAAVLAALAVPWYAEVWRSTHTLSGEQVDAAVASLPLHEKVAALRRVDWRSALDLVLISHIWTGGWSFLGVRSWIYRIFEIFGIVISLGLLRLGWLRLRSAISHRRLSDTDCRLLLLGSAAVLLFAGVMYHGVMIFLVYGMSLALGWYLYAIVAAEVTLATVGAIGLLGRRRGLMFSTGALVLWALLDLYTMHLRLIPYHTGFIRHTPDGGLPVFRPGVLFDGSGAWSELVSRMAVNRPAFGGSSELAVVLCWAGYLACTGAVVALGLSLLGQMHASRRRSVELHTLAASAAGPGVAGALHPD